MATAALAALAVMSPWLMRNYLLFHKFIPVRSGFGLELYIGNNGYSQRWVNSSLHPNHNDAELSEYERIGEIAYMDHKLQQAKDYIAQHPAWFVHMTFRRIIYMWTGYWSFDHAYLEGRTARSAEYFPEHDHDVARPDRSQARLETRCTASHPLRHRAGSVPAPLLHLPSRNLLLPPRRPADSGPCRSSRLVIPPS